MAVIDYTNSQAFAAKLTNIGNAIRSKTLSTDTYTLEEMVTAIDNMGSADRNANLVSPTSATFTVARCLDYLNVTGLDFSGVTSLNYAFQNASNLTSIIGIEDIDTSNVIDMSYVFYNCSSLTSLDLTGWDVSNVTIIRDIFNNCSSLTSLDVSNWNISKVSNSQYNGLSNAFYGCLSLTSLDLSSWNTSNIANMASMFENCSKLTEIKGIENFDTSNVTGYSSGAFYGFTSMFSRCSSLTGPLDLTGWDVSSVTAAGSMFFNCTSLTEVNLSGWNWNSLTNTNYGLTQMFYYCTSLTTANLANWNTSNIKRTYSMFSNCTSLTNLDLTGWDFSGILNIQQMFYNCNNLSNLTLPSSVDFSSVTNYSSAFINLHHDALVGLFNALITYPGTGLQTLQCGTGNATGNYGYASLTAEEIAIATDKGYTVTT